MTKRFSGYETHVGNLHGCEVEWTKKSGQWKLKELEGTDFTIQADLVLLAMGFLHVTHSGLIEKLGLKQDDRGNLAVQDYQTSEPWVFAAGDAIIGASLVVRAINSGRLAAAAINRWLTTQ
jgi:NADPH-dependent glutamate synthase beta subunit-like oxidoreductase